MKNKLSITVEGVYIGDFRIFNNSLYDISEFTDRFYRASGINFAVEEKMSEDGHFIILDGSGLIADEYSIKIENGNIVLRGSRDSLIRAVEEFTGVLLSRTDGENHDLTAADNISGSIGKRTIYTKEQLMRLMTDIYNDKNVLIVGEEIQGQQNTCAADGIRRFADATGEYPGIIGLDLACYGIDLTRKTDVQWSGFICDIVDHCSKGGIVTISSHFENPSGNRKNRDRCRGLLGYDDTPEGYEKAFRDLITEGTEYNALFKKELETDARFLKALGDNGIPVIWRPLHETNGNWFWFCTVQNSAVLDPSCLVNVWRYIYDLYTKELGLDNLIWNYTPIVSSNTEDKPGYLMSTTYLYPGDEYCDMVGVDWYTAGNLEIKAGDNYQRLLDRSKKIGAIAEFGPGGDRLAKAISDQPALYSSMDMYRDLTKLRDMDLSFVYLLTWGERWGFDAMGSGKDFVKTGMGLSRSDVKTRFEALGYYADPVNHEHLGISKPQIDFGLPYIGTIRPRSTRETESSNWMLGCETLDRDYADYDRYKEYLCPLGIHTLRMQGGWAKTERQPGVYNWQWLDHIIDDAVSRGLRIWLQTGYGNPIYPGAGGSNLGAGMPLSEEGRAAYERWVEAMVLRYADRVQDWEVWNEPNFSDNKVNTPEIAAEFNLRTASIIKAIQPSVRISALAMGHIDPDYAERFFQYLHERGACGLFHNVTYHDYVYNPDANKLAVWRLRQIVEKYAPGLILRQGENGAPSARGSGGAMFDHDWSEISQAKWDTRRMLENLGNDIQCSVFSIAEMQYSGNGPITKTNTKGLLMTDSKNRVLRPKIAYHAVQHVTAVFDDTLERMREAGFRHTLDERDTGAYWYSTDRDVAVYGYRHKSTGKPLYTIWKCDAVPGDDCTLQTLNFAFVGSHFEDPVLVDILTGNIYQIPANLWRHETEIDRFYRIPVYDSPILLAERSLIPC